MSKKRASCKDASSKDSASATPLKRRRMRSSSTPCLTVWEFANQIHAGDGMKRFRKCTKWDASAKEHLKGVLCLVESQQQGPRFQPSTSIMGEIVGFDKEKLQLVVQTYNRSGDKEGKPLSEDYRDLWYLPRLLSSVTIDGKPHSVDRYVY